MSIHGLIMDYQLNLPSILRRTEQLYFDREIVSRLPDKSLHRYTIGEMVPRAKRLAVALRKLGLEDGYRVATFCWNHSQHLEAYMGIPCAGGVLHTLNLRLHENDLSYIANHAGDKIAIVDEMVRLGLPPGNPFFGEAGDAGPGRGCRLPPRAHRRRGGSRP